MTLNADGTGTVEMVFPDRSESESASITWSQEGDIVTIFSVKTTTATLSDGQLIWSMDELNTIISREAPTATVLGTPIAAESVEAFYGTWKSGICSHNGMIMNADIPDTDFFITVTADKTTLTKADGSTYVIPVVFENGSLFIREQAGETKVQLCDDGTLAMILPYNEGTAIIYLDRID